MSLVIILWSIDYNLHRTYYRIRLKVSVHTVCTIRSELQSGWITTILYDDITVGLDTKVGSRRDFKVL